VKKRNQEDPQDNDGMSTKALVVIILLALTLMAAALFGWKPLG
jgi:hypothetical protein